MLDGVRWPWEWGLGKATFQCPACGEYVPTTRVSRRISVECTCCGSVVNTFSLEVETPPRPKQQWTPPPPAEDTLGDGGSWVNYRPD